MASKYSSVEVERLRRLQKVEDDIIRVNHDIAALDRLARAGGQREQIMKNSKSANIVIPDRSYEGDREWLPKIKPRYDESASPQGKHDAGRGHPTVMLANYLNSGFKNLKGNDITRGTPHKGLSALFLDNNHTKQSGKASFGINEEINSHLFAKEIDTSPSGAIDTFNRKPTDGIQFQFRQGISPYESAKALKQKLMSKDAALTNSIMMQQRSQHTLNKSIRASHLMVAGRDRSSTNYQLDDAKKQYLREPQTASTGIYSSGGLSNKIEPLASDLRNPSLYSPAIEQLSGGYLPTVSKAGIVHSRDRLRKLSQRNNSIQQDEIVELDHNTKRKSTLLRPSISSNLYSQPLNQEISVEPEIMNRGAKIDWGLPTSIKLDISVEFKLEKVLGKGNSSTVYRGYDFRLNLPVAVKILEKASLKENYLRDMLQKEIDISVRLLHPHLAKLQRVLQDGNKVYLVQEYCGNQTLSQFAEQKKISEAKAKSIFKQVTSAVNYMHLHGFAHRDLKFSNILINDYGLVKLVDFGFACDATKKQRIFCGTPSYMPPELIQKKEYVPMFVDLWSLGVILFKLLTNNYPFGACNDKELEHRIQNSKFKYVATLKPELHKLVESLLCYQPNDRMQTDSILNFVWFKH